MATSFDTDNSVKTYHVGVVIFAGLYSGVRSFISRLIKGDNYHHDSNEFISSINFKKYIIDNAEVDLSITLEPISFLSNNMISRYFQRSYFIILLFDLTDISTFNLILEFKERYANLITNNSHIFLVGTKCDLVNERKVNSNMIESLRTNIGCEYFETSAKTGQGVNECFERIAHQGKENIETNNEVHLEDQVDIDTLCVDNKEKKKSCI